MGCCFSTGGAPDELKVEAFGVKSPPEKEVETVKEVLSVTETPTRQSPPVPAKSSSKIEIFKVDQKIEKIEKTREQVVDKAKEGEATTKEAESKIEVIKNQTAPTDFAEEMSEVSEAWESRSTTTITEIRDAYDEVESGEVKQRLVNRSPARYSRRGAAVPNTQNRRPEWDTRYRNASVIRQVPRRERESSQTPVRRPVAGTGRAAGKSPARRNASPARRNGPTRPNSPGPTRPAHLEKRKLEESLENPLVSLECFIFL